MHRLKSGTTILLSDDNVRQHLLIKTEALEYALEAMLGDRLRHPLEFKPTLDWTRGLAASLRHQLDMLMLEMSRGDGIPGNTVALASFTDLAITLVLRGSPHNYLGRLESRGRRDAVPAYIRHDEDFMHAHADTPIRLAQVADAAGCSVRTLEVAFRRFRDMTPLAALRAIRLERVHVELSQDPNGRSLPQIARRFGFTDAARFATGYRRRFGEAPLEAARRNFR